MLIFVAIFYPFSQFCEIDISLLSLQKQPNTVPNLFQSGVEYGKYEGVSFSQTPVWRSSSDSFSVIVVIVLVLFIVIVVVIVIVIVVVIVIVMVMVMVIVVVSDLFSVPDGIGSRRDDGGQPIIGRRSDGTDTYKQINK